MAMKMTIFYFSRQFIILFNEFVILVNVGRSPALLGVRVVLVLFLFYIVLWFLLVSVLSVYVKILVHVLLVNFWLEMSSHCGTTGLYMYE